MTTRAYFHPGTLLHDPKPMPGLAPARLHAVREALQQIEGLAWGSADPIDLETLQLVHTPDYVAAIATPIEAGRQRKFDRDTYAMAHTYQAALRSAGLAAAATRAVVAGDARSAFCLASPGGHHAEADMAQGFCFFNTVAMAGVMAQAQLGITRVAVLDFDAHHGNGTQSLFWSCKNRLLISLHEETTLSGFANETGACDNILNIPLKPGSDGAVFRHAIETLALPKLKQFQPDLLLVSAGFDAHRADPLANLNWEGDDYAWIGQRLAALGLPLVAVMEGGYNLATIGGLAAAFVTGMMR
jgi:acetoin utilization deacetylase AcuC-like enzyme